MDFLSFHTLLLLAAAFLAGALNAVAGGGTMFTFPALMFTGIPAIAANATSKLGIWPGSVASVFAYRRELQEYRRYLPLLLPVSLIGGWLGAALLIITPPERFEFLVPWLLLLATALFAYGKQVKQWLSGFRRPKNSPESGTRHLRPLMAVLFHFATAVYGGFFGAGIGILMLAMMEMLGLKNIHGMNGLKTLLGAGIHTSAVLAFLFTGAVVWHAAVILIVGGILGGYLGARAALTLPQTYVRRFVIAVGLASSLYFWRQ